MATVSKDEDWKCTAEMQQDLIELHEENKKKWKADITKMIRDHPSIFSILTLGVKDDGDNLYTFEEFTSHLEGGLDNQQLLKLIYDDIDHSDNTHVKLIAIHRWLNDIKLKKESEIIKDHKWLFTKILHVQASHLDADGSGEVDREEFISYFVKKVGFPSKIANAMFDDIDVNGDGDLSVMEYTKWKTKHNKPHKLKKFLDNIDEQLAQQEKKKEKDQKKIENAVIADMDDNKADMDDNKDNLQKRFDELNIKYNQLELKHNNLLQEQLSAEEKAKNADNNEEETKQKMQVLQSENDKLIIDQEVSQLLQTEEHQTQIDSMKETNDSLQKQIKKLIIDNEELKNENTQLSNSIKLNNTSNNDQQIIGLKEEINKNKQENNEFKIQIQTQETEINNMKQTNDSLEKQGKKLIAENEELSNNIKVKNDTIDEQNKTITDLKKQNELNLNDNRSQSPSDARSQSPILVTESNTNLVQLSDEKMEEKKDATNDVTSEAARIHSWLIDFNSKDKKAVQKLNKDLVSLLVKLPETDKQDLQQVYYAQYGTTLTKDIKSRIGKGIQAYAIHIIKGLLMTRVVYDVLSMMQAISNNDIESVADVICCRSIEQLSQLCIMYKKQRKLELLPQIKAFSIKGNKNTLGKVIDCIFNLDIEDMSRIEKDLKFMTETKKFRNDQKERLVMIFMRNSVKYIAALNEKFEAATQDSLIRFIDKKLGGKSTVGYFCKTRILYATDSADYYAQKIKKANKNQKKIANIFIQRMEIDLNQIKKVWTMKKYGDGKDLKQWIDQKISNSNGGYLLQEMLENCS